MNILYAQFIGAAALLTIVLSVQFKKKKNIMLVQLIANVLYSVQYALLNVPSAAYLNIITILRSYTYYQYDKKRKKIPLFFLIFYCLLSLIVGYLLYDNILVIIPITITIAYTIGAYYKDANVFRKVFLVSAFVWLFYNYKVEAYVGMFGNVCEIVSTYIAINRYTKKAKKLS